MVKTILFSVLLCNALYSWSQRDTTTYQQFAATQLQQDLDSLYLNMQQNHPDLFAHYKKADADLVFRSLRSQITKPMNRLEFTRLVSPFIALFRDGHTFVDTDFEGEDFEKYAGGGGRFFPLGVYILRHKLYAGKTDLSATTLQKGDEIVSLNGLKAATIIEQLKSMWSADGEQNAIATTERLFSYGLWAVYQWGNLITVDYIRNGVKKTEVLAGIGKKGFLSLTFNSGGAIRQLHLYPEYSLAVVEINSYGSVEKTNRFIDSCFGVIKEKTIRNVALDLRKNGGGNSFIGDYFIAHVSRKEYSTISRKKWHLSPMVMQLKTDHWLRRSIDNDRKTYTQNGAFLESPLFAASRGASLQNDSLFVDAKLYLLTSPRTYSSAHMTAIAVKCGELGTIIGQPTGERLNLTGEILEYETPNSRLKIVIPVASYKAACGNGEEIGVRPDHMVETTIEDIRSGRDPELLYLQKMITTGGR